MCMCDWDEYVGHDWIHVYYVQRSLDKGLNATVSDERASLPSPWSQPRTTAAAAMQCKAQECNNDKFTPLFNTSQL